MQLTAALESFLLQPLATATVGDFEGLTARERAVLDVLVQGLATDAMAERLGMTEKTVRNHLSTIYSKLGVENRAKSSLYDLQQAGRRKPRAGHRAGSRQGLRPQTQG